MGVRNLLLLLFFCFFVFFPLTEFLFGLIWFVRNWYSNETWRRIIFWEGLLELNRGGFLWVLSRTSDYSLMQPKSFNLINN